MKKTFTYNRFLLLWLLFMAIVLIVAFFGQLQSWLFLEVNREITGSYLVLKLGFSVLLAPLLETLVFQHWLLMLLKNKLPLSTEVKKWLWAVVLSSLIFALAHTRTPLHLLAAFCIGLVLGGTYLIYFFRKDLNPILAVYLLHAGNNLLWFIVRDLAVWEV